MRLIITCAEPNLAAAHELANEELTSDIRKYDKPGWGWFFYKGNIRFFVRGIKNGISVTQTHPKI